MNQADELAGQLRDEQRGMWEEANARSLQDKVEITKLAIADAEEAARRRLEDATLPAWPRDNELRYNAYREASRRLGYKGHRVPLPKAVELIMRARWPGDGRVGFKLK
jgi:hypothetical protein